MSTTEPGQRLEQTVRRVGELHTAPSLARRLLELTSETDYEVKEIARCLETDPALASKVLRIVNSSQYGLAHKITSLRSAVAFMGRRSLRLIVTTFSLVEGLAKGVSGRLFQAYWRNALTMAVAAARLARRRKDLAKDEAYAAGLIADLGMLALAQVERNRYTRLMSDSPPESNLIHVERAEFGFDHAELGARLLTVWNFPEELVEVVARHHDPELAAGPLALVAQGAAGLTEVLWSISSPRTAAVRAFLHAHFDVDTDAFIDLAVGCRDDIAQSANLLGVKFQETYDCQALLEEARKRQFELSLETALDLDSLSASLEDRAAP